MSPLVPLAMTSRLTHLLRGLAFASLVLLTCAFAWAGPKHEVTKEELAAARQLFTEGKALESEGDWAGALEKFDRVAAVKMTPQVRFHVALCHEHLGRWVDAVNGFELAEQEARASGATDVEDNAPKRAEGLRARLAHITLRVSGTVRTSKILLDGRPVSMALADTAIPLDPGTHRVQVTRDGEETFSEELEFAEAESRELELEIDDPEPPPPPPPKHPNTGKDKPGPPPPSEPPPRWISYVVGGVGLAAIGGGVATFVLRQGELSNIRCDDPAAFIGCNPEDVDSADLAQQYDIASKVLWGVGGAALATGVVLWFVLAPDDDQPATGAAAVGLAPAVGGLQLLGSF